jgi:hypothetical protein
VAVFGDGAFTAGRQLLPWAWVYMLLGGSVGGGGGLAE